MTPALESLWEQVRDWSHPEHPFLDPLYSPSSLMPACDFTLWVRDRLLDGDDQSVRLLMCYIGTELSLWTRQLEGFFTWRVPGYEGVVEAELRAVMLLCYRYAWVHDFRHLVFDWPRLWRVVLAAQRQETEFDSRIAVVPPTTRLVVVDSATRGVGDGLRRMPWTLGYGDRCYGNNAKWNVSFVDWLGCYTLPPPSVPFPPTMVNRDELRALAAACGITLVSKSKKAMMVEVATHEVLVAALWKEHGADLVVWADVSRCDALLWIKHADDQLPLAQSLALEAAQSFMWHDHPHCNRIRPRETLSFEESLKAVHETHRGMAVGRRDYEKV
ncbi:MAG: hypothetical protein R3F13_11845, partial [Prosthecobacter sp.]